MAAENPVPDKDSPGHKVFSIRIDQTQYEWPDEKITGAQLRGALLHESELARTDPDPQFLHRPMRYDIGLPSPVI